MKKISYIAVGAFLSIVLGVAVYSQETLSSYFGGHLPSMNQRQELAEGCLISHYVGTREQNNELLACLKAQDSDIAGAFLEQNLGTSSGGYAPVTGYQSRTTQYISASATTIPVVSTKDKAGNAITLSNLSGSTTVKVYMNLEPGSSKEEPIVCTGVTATSWTGCTRGLSFQGSDESSSSTIAKTHNAGASVIITNIAQFFNQFASLEGQQEINNRKIFLIFPEFISDTTPTTSRQFATKQYADNIANQGAATSSETVAGIAELATQIEMASTTDLGVNRPLILQARYATSSPDVRGLYIPIAMNDGYLSQKWIDYSTSTWSGRHHFSSTTNFTASSSLYRFGDDTGPTNTYRVTTTPALELYRYGTKVTFRASVTSTAGATLNIDSLGTRTLLRFNRVIGFGDIRGGQITEAIYDGTNFQLTSPIGGQVNTGLVPVNTSQTNATTTRDFGGATPNTTMVLNHFIMPYDMVVSKISLLAGTTATPGNITVGIISGDGQTVISSSTLNIPGSGTQTLTLSTPISLSVGSYYFAITKVGSTDTVFPSWNTDRAPVKVFADGTGSVDAVSAGNVTVNANSLSTFNPNTVTYGSDNAVIFRLD